MKCNQCGTEFEGNFCPTCGTKVETDTPVMFSTMQQEGFQQSAFTKAAKPMKAKKKKPFFLRWWFILLVIVVAGMLLLSKGGDNEDKINWSEMELGNMLPEPPSQKGTLYEDSKEQLWVSLDQVSDEQYKDYLDACVEKGFTTDADESSDSYRAYDEDGYCLDMSHIGDSLSIDLNAPIELSQITWPTSTPGNLLPVPKSTEGNFSYEHEDSFFVYIGDTTKADYDEYVTACSEKGFTVDYNKGDDYYDAANADGWTISLQYVGNHMMTINISAPTEEEDSSNTSTPSNDETESNTTTEPEETKEDTDTDGLDPDFKAAMDSYEEFIDEYVSFMKKYNENPNDLGLLADYATYMSKYADFMEDFEQWEDEEMNTAETAYYIEVQARVNQKLLEVSQ